jgi:DNA-binding NarL/FixJ family response regulator
MMADTWTERETEILCETIADGLSFGEAAKRVNKSRPAIQSKWRKIVRALGPQAA